MTKPEERRVVSADEYMQERRRRVEETLRLDPAVPVMLGDQQYQLVCNMAAVKALYKDTGHSMLSESLTPVLENPVIFSSLFYNLLKARHPEMTQEKVDSLMDARQYIYYSDRLVTACRLFQPDMTDLVTPEMLEFEKAQEEQRKQKDPTLKPALSS